MRQGEAGAPIDALDVHAKKRVPFRLRGLVQGFRWATNARVVVYGALSPPSRRTVSSTASRNAVPEDTSHSTARFSPGNSAQVRFAAPLSMSATHTEAPS